eukprot:SAG31_NODE_9277_length_1306_cov_0.760563_1_plen_93_part_00
MAGSVIVDFHVLPDPVTSAPIEMTTMQDRLTTGASVAGVTLSADPIADIGVVEAPARGTIALPVGEARAFTITHKLLYMLFASWICLYARPW